MKVNFDVYLFTVTKRLINLLITRVDVSVFTVLTSFMDAPYRKRWHHMKAHVQLRGIHG